MKSHLELGIVSLDQKIKLISDNLPFAYQFVKGRVKVNQRRIRIISDILLKREIDIQGANILEVGSHIGFGLITAETSKDCIGLEYYFENCRHAKNIADAFEKKRTYFITGTAETLPFAPNAFDFIQTHHVIEHMPPEHWGAYISELERVLKPNGACLISFPHWHNPIEPHYGLPFLHWLPKQYRPSYARFTPREDHIESAELAYEPVMSGKAELIFTELPTIKKVKSIVNRNFTKSEDITREFARHPLMKEHLGPIKHKLAVLLTNTWICPERKLLLYK